jgi:hypothetical protein
MSMKSTRDDRDDALLIEALKSREYSDPGPARLEFERRRFVARVVQEESRPSRVAWRTIFVGGFAGAAAVAAAAVLLLVFVFPAAIDLAEPEVSLTGVWHLEAGDAIAAGTPVRVSDTGRASLVLPDGTALWAGPGTRMIVEESDGSRIRVERGHLLARVQPRTTAARFEVVTPDAEVQVHGTVFSVQVLEERTTVRLHEGVVRLICGDKSVAMEAGHRVVASDGAILSMDDFGEQEAVVDLELGGGASAVLASVTPEVVTPVPEAAILGEPAEPTIIVADVQEDLGAAEPAEDLPPAASKTGSAKRPTLRDRVEEAFAAARYAEVIELTSDTADNALRFYRARALARVGRWAEAGETYAVVAEDDHSLRAEALYRASSAFKRARLYPRALDMANQAISLGGPNADHAWGIKLSALTGLKQYQAAASQAGVYLDLFPGGAHVGEAYFVQGTGERLSKKWSAAARAYGSFLSRGTGPTTMRDDASFYHGYCLLKAGNGDAGRKALEDYLVQYPRGRHVQQAQTALSQ